MGELSRKVDVDKLISYSDDLVEFLKDKRDVNNLTQCLDNFKSLQSSCDDDFNEVQIAIQGSCLLFTFSVWFTRNIWVFLRCFF